MKKILVFIAVLILFQSCKIVDYSYAQSSSLIYGKVDENCILYKSLDVLGSDYMFVVPETYFVLIIDDLDEEMYKVQYRNYIGYVQKNKVKICSFEPKVKYLENIKFDIKSTSGTQIWQRPSDSSKILTTVSAGETNINYIGASYGDTPSGGRSNLWYYVSYTSNEFSTNVYEGYIYSENTTNLTPISINTENNELLNNSDGINKLNNFSNPTLQTIIVSFIAVPIILLFVIILYKLVKKYQKYTNKNIILDNEKVVDDAEKLSDVGCLKNEIEKYQNANFVKRKKDKTQNEKPYPNFPSYETDDDWLWFWP